MMFKFNYLKKSYFSQPFAIFKLLGVLLILSGCQHGNETSHTYFGGKIKNPKDKYVYFLKGRKVMDSARLNEHHKFMFKIDSLELGLYSFKHGAEFQYLYLEPQDSLLMYLNTWDFDESLIFSGKGSAKNNFLINLYLQQERVEKNFKSNYKLDEEAFSKVIDQGIEKELEEYNQFLETQPNAPSDFFDKLVKTGIYFPFYYYKERYPYNHQKALGLDAPPELTEDFYAYRKQIELNDESLIDYMWNLAFINNYLYNLARAELMKDPENKNFELEFMKIVNDKIEIEEFRNSLLARGAWGSLSNKNLTKEDCEELYAYFFKHCSNEDYKKELKKSIAQKEKITCGEELPKLLAYNYDQSEVEINQLIKNSNAVIYFWPTDLGRVQLLNEKLRYLEQKHPNIVFIGIERHKSNEEWKAFVTNEKLQKQHQFKLEKNSETYEWYDGDMARTIIVNDQGKVENGYVFFLDSHLNHYLKEINKR